MQGPARWGRLGESAAWLVTAVAGSIMVSQAIGLDGFRLLASVQSFTPLVIPVMAVAAAVGLWRRWSALAATAAAVGIGGLLLAAPIVFPPGQRPVPDDAVGLRAGAVNLLYTNVRTDEIADVLAERDLDIIVFTEYTAEHQAALLGHSLVEAFPHRVERDGLLAGGVAVWSRFPLSTAEPPDTVNYSVDAVVDGPDGEIRVLAVHPPTPIYNFSGWKRDLNLIGDAVRGRDEPTLVIGDFNASYWHPIFRDLLRAGLVDAHMANGEGWSASWPTDVPVPPFVRLDHALTNRALVSTDVADFRVPGSDHSGLEVRVVPAR